MRILTVLISCSVSVAIGVGAGWLLWGGGGGGGEVYAGMSQAEIDRKAFDAIDATVLARPTDARCRQRRFDEGVFDCKVSWEDDSTNGVGREWAVRFRGDVAVRASNLTL